MFVETAATDHADIVLAECSTWSSGHQQYSYLHLMEGTRFRLSGGWDKQIISLQARDEGDAARYSILTTWPRHAY
jgi:hypothetical protein